MPQKKRSFRKSEYTLLDYGGAIRESGFAGKKHFFTVGGGIVDQIQMWSRGLVPIGIGILFKPFSLSAEKGGRDAIDPFRLEAVASRSSSRRIDERDSADNSAFFFRDFTIVKG